MNKFIYTTFLLLCIAKITVCQTIPKVSSGSIVQLKNVSSKYVDARNIDIWLPENYSAKKRYAVVYMHDGQMLFDSNITWNKQEWQVDENFTTLLKKHKIKNCIVVGIYNNGSKRFAEYFPKNSLQYIHSNTDTTGFNNRLNNNQPLANNYLKFLVTELKPKIDSMFSTYNNAKNTFIIGSSMGGLISLYAMVEYPNIFGGAACLSTHLPVLFKANYGFPNIINRYLQAHLPQPYNHKIYFDYGTKTLDSLYKPYQQIIDTTLINKGFTSKNWISKEFINDDHSEKSWAKRLSIPLQFLLKK